jgi:hypothetical protein
MPVRTVGCFRGQKMLETVFFLKRMVDIDSNNMADLQNLARPPLLRFPSLLGDHIID